MILEDHQPLDVGHQRSINLAFQHLIPLCDPSWITYPGFLPGDAGGT
jgi:hypothetical protein